MTIQAKTFVTTLIAPAGATAITIGLLMLMYALINVEASVPEPKELFVIADVIQEDPPKIIDIEESIEEIDEPILPPGRIEFTSEETEVVTFQEEMTTIFDDPVIGAVASGTLIATVQVQPNYPDIALRRGLEGWVILGFDVTRLGTTENIVVLESEPGSYFDRAAIRALERWKYMPKKVDGKAVATTNLQTKLVFELED